MAQQYVFVRMRRSDFDKIMNEKKKPMEQELRMITGKHVKIKNIQLFNIAANSSWDLGLNANRKLVNSIKLKPKRK